ncbi:GAF domain-containing SpoIIE family protein phosphatase [Halalkalibacter akibai]|uniref:GAF domain-containing protein n=1 Tax=Halalkalibacter akibai (strain ATCC 43226 / DSM 21942 / CIP 109018 / JCM 9157 / 1139) TaxID=1236973 RepID=W4R046_HALA3|nr:GAF domain-containing SpoIIE family protein phosphatase [Halalkalibacter akibai]GAE37522.1 hypothetical protein JCM9157_4830 [Halalkalibacter akibai JCM 9157]
MKRNLSKFEESAQTVLNLMKDTISAKTFFVATTQDDRFKILKKINEDGGCEIPPEVDTPLKDSYCGKVVGNMEPLLIEDALKSELVKDMEVTNSFSIGSYLGVPIKLEDGTAFGTLCALDPNPNVLSELDIKKLEGYAELIANSLALEESFRKLKDYEIQTKREFQLARNVQQALLSKPYYDENLEIDFIYTPSFHLSGDICTWYEIEENVYGIAVLDVMGHGVSSALIGMVLRTSLENFIKDKVTPYEVMDQLNKVLFHLFEEEKEVVTFVTGIYLLVDFNKRSINYMNAGHPPGIVFHTGASTLLDKGSIPLGIYKDLKREYGHFEFEHIDEILLYTDGLTDYLYENGKKTTETLINKFHSKDKVGLSTIDFFKKLVHERPVHDDDICLVTVKFLNSTLSQKSVLLKHHELEIY